jgi:hypothetical protein
MYHRREPVVGARPLLILWPFGPVALVYDLADTEGEPVPEDVFVFRARGSVDRDVVLAIFPRLLKQGIECRLVDEGSGRAGLVRSRTAEWVAGHPRD